MCNNSPETAQRNKEEISDNQKQEYIRLAYQSTLEDIRFFKNQQWRVVYYTLLLYVAIISGAVTFEKKIAGIYSWLILFSFSISILSIVQMLSLQNSLKEQRDEKEKARDKMPLNIPELFFKKEQEKENCDFCFWILIAVIFLSAVTTLLILVNLNCPSPTTCYCH